VDIRIGIVIFWHPHRKYGFIQADSGERSIHFTIATYSVIRETEPGKINFEKKPNQVYPRKGDKVVFTPPKMKRKGLKTHHWTYCDAVPQEILLALSLAQDSTKNRQKAS
jgi:hypothetical protein